MGKLEANSEFCGSSSKTDYVEILNENQLDILKEEFSRLKDACYLDHGGATLYAKSQLNLSAAELQSTLFSNPHSRNPSSSITSDATDYIRQRVLSHFGTNEEEYSVIFTSGATSAFKLVAESFSFNGGSFAYLEESHTSVVGMREFLLSNPDGFPSDRRSHESQKQLKEQVADLNAVSKGSSTQKSPQPEEGTDAFPARISNNNNVMNCSSVCSSTEGANNGTVYCISKSTLDHLMDSFSPHSTFASQNLKGLDEGTISSHNEHTLFNPPQLPQMCQSCSNFDKPNDDEKPVKSITRNNLFAYPAQCNFSGYKYPLEWMKPIQNGHLEGITKMDLFFLDKLPQKEIDLILKSCKICSSNQIHSEFVTQRCIKCNKEERMNFDGNQKWFVLLDAASFVGSNPLDLSKYNPDFVALSFYKMFGWPTGIGALLVRNKSGFVLNKKAYFGGGTVNISLPSSPFHVKRSKLHERFEDGTINFLSIISLKHGFDTLTKLCGSMEVIRKRTFRLAQYLFKKLSNMKYPNGKPVAKIYSDTLYTSEMTQGPVLTFNLLRQDGTIIGYSEMEQIAYLHDVHLRYGCFCNPGACRRHLGLTPEQVLKHFEAGHVCGDMRDIIDGQPTGAIRVSFGYMSTRENADFLLQLISKCWIHPIINEHCDTKLTKEKAQLQKSSETSEKMRLLRIFVYPVKSCAPFEVKGAWPLGPHGFLYDREWLIVNSAGVPLTAKREPRLCQIQPSIDITNRRLELYFNGHEKISIPLEIEKTEPDTIDKRAIKAELCTSKVCGDTVIGLDCGQEVADWLSLVLDKPGLKLIRMSPDHHRKPRNSLEEISLANQSQYLLLSMGSLRRLARELISKRLLSSLNISTTIIHTTNEMNPQGISTHEPHFVAKGTFTNYKEGDQGSNGSKVQPREGRLQASSSPLDGSKQSNSYINDEEFRVIESLIGRFRSNLVVSEDPSSVYDEEESWKQVQIGSVDFESGGPCIRCATICMDPITGTRSSEPLLTLSAIRGGRPNFGIHLYATKNNNKQPDSIMHIGDAVEITKYISDGDADFKMQIRYKSSSKINAEPKPTRARELLENID